MNSRFSLLLGAALLVSPCAYSQIPDLAESHIDANVPAPKDFKPLLVRDLTAHLKPKLGEGITVAYELLRDGPTQAGVAYPKFYLWVTATKPDKTVVEGAARVAAIKQKEFQVTDFLTSVEITSQPDSIAHIFPQALLDKIRKKAGINQ